MIIRDNANGSTELIKVRSSVHLKQLNSGLDMKINSKVLMHAGTP